MLLHARFTESANTDSRSRFFTTIPESEYDPAIRIYADQAYSGESLSAVVQTTSKAMEAFMADLEESQLTHRYGLGKWTVAEVLQHVISYEQIFVDRINLVLDPEAKPRLPRYTQRSTASPGRSKSRGELHAQFRAVRQQLTVIVETISESEQRQLGSIDGIKASVRAMVVCASGHQRHHFGVLRERYGRPTRRARIPVDPEND